jgi:hypothetical protein
VLFSYNGDQLSKGTSAGDYTPALYIDKNGKLRGEFWNGAPQNIIQSNTVVTDGAWHHVALAGAGDDQTLYLDGVAKGSVAGTIARFDSGSSTNINIGGGFLGGAWPDHANTGKAPAVATYFKGSISDVAFFNQTLDPTTVATLNRAGRVAQPVLSTVTRPSGGVTASISYNKTSGKVEKVVDENGGTWSLSKPSVVGSSQVYAASVLGAKPADYWRLRDTAGAINPVDEVAGNDATYSSVNLGVDGHFVDAKAAGFNGTSSYVEMPEQDIPATSPTTVEMWFKLPDKNAKGGVLFGCQNDPIDAPGTGGWTPALYVGTDGKLRGGFWANKSSLANGTTSR